MRFFNLSLLICAVASVGCFFGCKTPEVSSDPTLARVENAELKLSDMTADGSWDTLSFDERSDRVEDWVKKESVYEKALSDGVADIPEVRRLIEDAKKKIVLNAYFSQVTDTLSVTEADVAAFFDAHPENFLLESNVYRLAIVTYMSGTTAWQYYGPATRKTITEVPEKNWLVRDVQTFDSVTAVPVDCPSMDLRPIEVGKITPPKSCGKDLKSLIILSKVDSGTVRPYAEVAELARSMAASAKRKEFIASFKDEIKKQQAIFIYPEEISKNSSHAD